MEVRKINGKKIKLSKISSINKQINSSMKLPELLKSIIQIARELLDCEGASLLLKDMQTGDLTFHTVKGGGENILNGEKVPKGEGIVGIVAETGESMAVNNVRDNPHFFKGIDNLSDFITRNLICVPMKVRDEIVGVLEAVNTIGRDKFNKTDEQFLSYIADQAAIAITTRRLLDELTARVHELSTLYDISQVISFQHFDESIFKSIIDSIAQSLEIGKISLIMHEKPSGRLILKCFHGLPPAVIEGMEIPKEGTISAQVFNTGSPLVVTDKEKELPNFETPEDRNYFGRSFISVPINFKEETLGVLNLTDKKDGGGFDSFDYRVISTIASNIAEAKQHIEYQKNLDLQKKIAREIEIAAEIQRKTLPSIPSSINDHKLSAFNKPAKDVGGDFYDLFRFSDDKYAVLVADISGKGIPAALFMGHAKNTIKAEARINYQPGTLLCSANHQIYEETETGLFVTLFYAVIDAHNAIITYGNAGHNDQLLIKKSSSEVIKLNARGKPLGMMGDSQFEEKVIFYEPGDMLILFTDGVLEYLGNGNIDTGEKKLIETFFETNDSDPSSFTEHLVKHLSDGSVDADFIDDFTIFSIRF